MENTFWTIITAIFSGIAATFVTMWWQTRSQHKAERLRIFSTLMSKRYDLTCEESVDALNMIDVAFHADVKVRKAWDEFNNATNLADSPEKEQKIRDKHLRLLEVMATAVGYRDINWENIKQFYFPKGLSDRKVEEAVLRRVQIDSAVAQLHKEQETQNSAQVSPKDQMTNQMVLAALQNPDGFVKLIEAAGKLPANKGTPKVRR